MLLGQMQIYQTFQASLAALPLSEVQAMANVLAARKIYFAIESYGLLPYACSTNQAGLYSAKQFLSDVKPPYDSGGRVAFVSLDGSGIGFALAGNNRPDNNCNLDLNTAFAQITIFMKRIHEVHPEIQFGLIAGLPNFNYNGTQCYFSSCTAFGGTDYRDVLNAEVQTARDAGEDYSFVHVDNPYDYMINHKGVSNVVAQRIIPLQQQASGLGLRFGLIHNSDLGGSADNGDDLDNKSVTYTANTMHSLELLSAGGGLSETDFIVESWFHFPHYILPETTQFNFAHLGNLMIQTYQSMLDQQGLPRAVANPNSGNYGSGNTTGSTMAPAPADAPIVTGAIADGADVSCNTLSPTAIKSLSTETILWLASTQPSGITLHENYLVARQSGYNGAFGNGEHLAWLAQDPTRQTTFTDAINTFAAQPIPPWATRVQHHIDRRAAGYQGPLYVRRRQLLPSGPV